jgi:hypothetical protein
MAMWVGVTPGDARRVEPYVNPRFAKFFRVSNGARRPYGPSAFELDGRNIVEGFRLAGYRAIGSGALGWFNPETPVGAVITSDFDTHFHPGFPWSIARQVAWIQGQLDEAAGQPVFVFLNVGETHTPYWHEGADWSVDDNPCVAFQTIDRRADCAQRQRACLEYVDAQLAPLLARFEAASVVATADHGDCWGEDGLWEHGVSHAATLTVPLVFRIEAELDRARGRLHAAENAYGLSRQAPFLQQSTMNFAKSAADREPLTLESVVRLRPDLTCTELDGEMIIVDAATGQYHCGGATGSAIIARLGEGAKVADIVASLIGMYDIDRETCASEVLAFVRALDEKKLLSNELRGTPRLA